MITVRKSNPSGTVIIDRPEKRNALTRQMVDDLLTAFSDLHQQSDVRAVILANSGSTFCSGVDLSELHSTAKREDSDEIWFADMQRLQRLIESMLQFPKPIIAACDGEAYGFGLALLLACDVIVGTPRCKVSAAAPKLGLVSGLVAPLLNFRCGGALTANVMLGLEQITSQQLHDSGLVNEIVDSDQVWVRAQGIATRIAETAPEAIQLTKRLINEMVGESMAQVLSSAAAATATACTTDAAAEGLQAFSEKRPADFS